MIGLKSICLFFSLSQRNKLVKDNINYVNYYLNKHHANLPRHIKEDIKQESYIGLVKASQRYDPSHNVKFITYASYYISGYTKNALRKYYKMENRINYGDYIIDDRNNKLYKNNERKQEYEEIIKNFKTFCNKSINKDILIDYYVNNLSQKDVSKKYNISRTKVSDILKNDIKLFKHYYIDKT